MNRLMIILPACVVVLFVAASAVFTVDEREKALVMQFGQVKKVIEEPGLAFKVPFIQDVVKYEDRILPIETQDMEVTPLDDRRLVVDAFALGRAKHR
jgi:membrane protease subunit HflC